MYKSFEVKDFRCFEELAIPKLERINLIAGVNNVGKTALLEALFLHSGAYNPELVMKISAFRGIDVMKIEPERLGVSPWDSIFHNFDKSRTVVLRGENEIAGRRILRIKETTPKLEEGLSRFIVEESGKPAGIALSSEIGRVLELESEEQRKRSRYHIIFDSKGPRVEPIPPPPPFRAFFQSDRIRPSPREEAELFGKLEIENRQDVLLHALRVIEPRLSRMAVVVAAGEPMLHGDVGIGRLIPLPLMGGGMVRLLGYILRIINAPKGVVFIDEVENGLHHSVMKEVWKTIGDVARAFDTQVFATTHSLECAVAAHTAFAENEIYDFSLHRLERVREKIRIVTYDKESLAAAIETGLEIR